MIFQEQFLIDFCIRTIIQIIVFVISTLLIWTWAKRKDWNDSIKPSVYINIVLLLVFYLLYMTSIGFVIAFYVFISPLDAPGFVYIQIFILITHSIFYFISGIIIAMWKYEIEIQLTIVPILLTVIIRAIASGLLYILIVMNLFP